MARLVRQALPDPPATYDQAYLSKLVSAINLYMFQATALAETVSASYICTAPVIIDPTGAIANSVPSTAGLPTGMIYLYKAGQAVGPHGEGAYYASIVTENDQ